MTTFHGGTTRRFRSLREPEPDWVRPIRFRGSDLSDGPDWAGLYAYRDELRRDTAMWADWWAPICAIAARRLGRPDARALLAEAIDGGFSQPELLGDDLIQAFGGDPDWPDLAARMADRDQAPSLVLTAWPGEPVGAGPELFRLPPEREELLRDRLPAPAGTAWETARAVLEWTTTRWAHANAHLDVDDAVVCLERAEAGERFACVEYSLVLTQALNAVAIPARRLSLRTRRYHLGVARCHVATEAWIDDLGRWVVLDGQHGGYWADPGGPPCGAVELQDRLRAGDPPPEFVRLAGRGPMADPDRTGWYQHFHSISVTGATWESGGFTPVFQRDQILEVPRLLSGPDRLYPDLSRVEIGLELRDGQPALRPATAHPFATGYAISAGPASANLATGDPVWVFDLTPGDHAIEISVRTRYGRLAPNPVRYLAGH